MQKVLDHFWKNDPVIYGLLEKSGLQPVRKLSPKYYFHRLCREIICQQLSDRVGDMICTRFENLFPKHPVQPDQLLQKPPETLRSCGMSGAKADYIRNVAQAIVDGKLSLVQLNSLPDEEVILRLTAVKGIGRWTAEMFLMFALSREDVFSFGDAGLRKAMEKLYGMEDGFDKERAERIISPWSPYKTYASRVLWFRLK